MSLEFRLNYYSKTDNKIKGLWCSPASICSILVGTQDRMKSILQSFSMYSPIFSAICWSKPLSNIDLTYKRKSENISKCQHNQNQLSGWAFKIKFKFDSYAKWIKYFTYISLAFKNFKTQTKRHGPNKENQFNSSKY